MGRLFYLNGLAEDETMRGFDSLQSHLNRFSQHSILGFQ